MVLKNYFGQYVSCNALVFSITQQSVSESYTAQVLLLLLSDAAILPSVCRSHLAQLAGCAASRPTRCAAPRPGQSRSTAAIGGGHIVLPCDNLFLLNCYMGVAVSCFAISKIVLNSKWCLNGSRKVLIFILTFEWEPCVKLMDKIIAQLFHNVLISMELPIS